MKSQRGFLGVAIYVLLLSADRAASQPSLCENLLLEMDRPNAGFGGAVAFGDFNGDGKNDVLVGSTDFDPGNGRAFLYLGSDSGLTKDPDWIFSSPDPGEFGFSVANAGDVNGDGYDDIAIGDPQWGANEGRVWVYAGSAVSNFATLLWSNSSFQNGAGFGYTVAGAGDVNGDGFADLLVGAPFYDAGFMDNGRAYVYFGPSFNIEIVFAVGGQPLENCGRSVDGAGDVNGDGFADIMAGANGYDLGCCADRGRLYFRYGAAAPGNLGPGWAASTGCDPDAPHNCACALPNSCGPGMGWSMAAAGNLNGDINPDTGLPLEDIIVGSFGGGNVYIWYGRTGTAGLGQPPDNQPNLKIDHPHGSTFGHSVAGGRRLLGTDFDAVIVGRPGANEVYVYGGSSSGLVTTPALILRIGQGGAQFGSAVAGGGDFDGDGADDMIVGAPLYDNPEANEGVALAYRGNPECLDTEPFSTCAMHLCGREKICAAGTVGGPFFPAETEYRLCNRTGQSVSYRVSNQAGASWLLFDGADEIIVNLGPFQTRIVTVSVGGQATSLPPGTYDDTILFEQINPPDAACTQTRSTRLVIGILSIDNVTPSTGPTTARENDDRIIVTLTGSLLTPEAVIRFGEFSAEPVYKRAACSNFESLDVYLPVRPPGAACAIQDSITVDVTATLGSQTVVGPAFTYQIVKSYVPQVYPTVQAAITASIPGTCIVVAPGDYQNPNSAQIFVDFRPDLTPRNDITLTSTSVDEPWETILRGGTSATNPQAVVRFDGNNEHTVLTGFLIVWGEVGVHVTGGARPLIFKNDIGKNFANGDGAGLRIEGGSSPTVLQNSISSNVSPARGGGIYVSDANAVIHDNVVSLNAAGSNGGGLYLDPSGPMDVRGNAITGNFAMRGAGVFVAAHSAATPTTLAFNTIDANTASSQGGGVFLDAELLDTPVNVLFTAVRENLAGRRGGGIYWSRNPVVTITGSTISGNRVNNFNGSGPVFFGAGVFVEDFARGSLLESDIVGNETLRGGGMAIDRKAAIRIERSILAYNVVAQQVPGDPTFWFGPGITSLKSLMV